PTHFDDHREHAGALIDDGRNHFDVAILLDGDEHIALATVRAPFRKRQTAPDVFRLRLVVPRELYRLIQPLVAADVRDMAADRRLITVAQHVFALELRRVHFELARDDVQLTLVGEKSLRVAGRAHVAAGNLVRVNHSFFDQAVGDLVRPGAGRRADQITRRLHRSIRAAVEQKIDMVRDDRAVFLDAGFDFDDRGVARITRGQFLGVVHQHFYRLTALLSQQLGTTTIP